MKALFRILEPQNRVERNTYFIFAHDFVLALRYLHFFPLLTDMTDSTKYIWRFLFTDGRSSITKRVFVSQCDKTVNKDWVKGQGSISMTAHKCEHLLHFRSWLCISVKIFAFFSVANRYDRFHKIHLTLPFHGWPIIHYETCFRFAMW